MARKKKKQLRARPKKTGGSSGVTKRDLLVTVDGLEIAKGYDGPLRGKPEPSLLVTVFGKHTPLDRAPNSTPEPACLLGRTLVRFTLGNSPPCLCVAPRDAVMRARIYTPTRILLLVIALEEDSGDDISATYARCEDLRALSIWDGRSAIPDPCAIADLFEQAAWSAALDEVENHGSETTPVRVLAGGQDVGDACTRDDYVAASAMRLELNAATEKVVRARTVSADEKNDWTSLLRIVLR